MNKTRENLIRRLERERDARLQAERLLEEKSDELYESLERVQSSQNMLNSALRNMANGLLLTTDENVVLLANERLRLIYPDYADFLVEGRGLEGWVYPLLEKPEYMQVANWHSTESSFEFNLSQDKVISVGVRRTREGYIASTHLDITEIRKSEIDRNRLLIELMSAQRLQAIGRMSGLIAHDFSNVIASIKGYAGFLQEDLPSTSDQQESVTRILSSTTNAENLIKEILHNVNQRQAVHQQVSLIPVIEECLDMVASTRSEHLDIAFDPPEAPIWISANEHRLSRVFMNLLVNAQRAMSGKNGVLTVLVESFGSLNPKTEVCQHPDIEPDKSKSVQVGMGSYAVPCVRVSIIDNGSGIDPNIMERCFEPYFTTRKEGESGGLGLASVADIVIDYAGTVRLTSQIDTGTITEVVFPRLESNIDYSISGIQRTSGDMESKVMIIEDDVDVGEMIKMTLHRDGISAELFNNPTTALETLLKSPKSWRLVVSDQLMPELKGTEIYQTLHQAGFTIPFILCSAQTDLLSPDLSNEVSTNFIAKPIDRKELIDKIRKYI